MMEQTQVTSRSLDFSVTVQFQELKTDYLPTATVLQSCETLREFPPLSVTAVTMAVPVISQVSSLMSFMSS